MKAWFITKNITNWFHNNFCKETVHQQTQDLCSAKYQVKALLLMDKAPVHPYVTHLVGDKACIRVIYFPANTNALIQPMDHGVIVAKLLCWRRFLEKVMVVLEYKEEKEQGFNTRGGTDTLESLKVSAEVCNLQLCRCLEGHFCIDPQSIRGTVC